MGREVFDEILKTIENDDMREFAEMCLDTVPQYFYTVPASSSGKYHPTYALGDGGLVRHTLALLRFMNYIFSLDCIKGKYNSRDRDMMRIAGMMHDTRKSGTQEDYEKNKYTKFDHPNLAANAVYHVYIDHQDQLKIEPGEVNIICSAIASHMGQFNTDKRNPGIELATPSSDEEIIVHICDYLASRKDIDVKFGDDIPAPAKEETPDINTWIIPFGKYSGKTLVEVNAENPGYIKWAKENISKEPFHTLVNQL